MEEIQTNLGKLEFIDDRIIYIKVKNNLSVTFKDGIEFRNNLLKLTDKKVGILVDAMNNKSTASINSIRFFSTDKAFNEICTYQCAITNKISIRRMFSSMNYVASRMVWALLLQVVHVLQH